MRHTFRRFRSGLHPAIDALAVGADGNLYGATQDGGEKKHIYKNGMGTIFRVAPMTP